MNDHIKDSNEFFENAVPCSAAQVKQMNKVRDAFRKLDASVIANVPNCPERDVARTQIKGACADALKAILTNGLPTEETEEEPETEAPAGDAVE